jgi:hypothetical protein
MRTIVMVCVLILLTFMYAPQRLHAVQSGCCVCEDGTCSDSVPGMKACNEQCTQDQHGKGRDYNANGTCNTTCSKGRDTNQKRGAK